MRSGCLGEGGEDAKLLAGGHSLLPLMKLRFASPSLLVDIGRLDDLRGIETGGDSFRIGALTRHADLQSRDDMGLIAAAAKQIADRRRSETAGRSAARSPTATPPRTCRRCCSPTAGRSSSRVRTASARSRRRTCFRATSRRRSPRARCSRTCASRRSRATATATRSSTAAPRTGRWSASARSSRRRRTAPARTSAWG